MDKVELTPAKLADIKKKAEVCHQEIWEDDVSVAYTVAACGFREDAQFIAAADPATVLALVEEIESLQIALRQALNQLKTAYRKESEAGHGNNM